MSYEPGGTYSVYNERLVRARKDHTCEACGECIRRTDRYYRVGIVFDVTAWAVRRCLRCQAIHRHLRTLSVDTWPEERLDCGRSYEDEWGKVPAEIAALAFTSGRELQGVGS